MAMNLASQFTPLSEKEAVQLKEKARSGNPIFSYPSSRA
jgi:hypothetical protein